MSRIDVKSGQTSTGLTLNYDSMYVSNGGTANDTTVNTGGKMYVEEGGTADNTTINVDGWVDVSSGGTADNTTVNSGGRLYICIGGTATNIVWTPGIGAVQVEQGGLATYVSQYSGVYYGSNNKLASHATLMESKTVGGVVSMYVYSGGTANNTTVNSGGSMYVRADGVANSTTVFSSGRISISSGGVANSTTVNSAGSMVVWNSGTANGTTLNAGGSMYVSSNGIANSTVVNPHGRMYVSAGGTATEITENGGYVKTYEDAFATFASNSFSYTVLSNASATVHSGTTASLTEIYSNSYLNVYSGGTANNTTVADTGRLYVYTSGEADLVTVNSSGLFYLGYDSFGSGGTANNTTVNSGGSMVVSQGGSANNTTINVGGWVDVSSGGTADNTTVNSGGRLYICIGGTATNIVWTPGIGAVQVEQGGLATYVSQYSGVYYGSNNKLASHATLMESKTVGGVVSMYVYSGGTANNTTVNSGGSMYVRADGVANSTTVFSSGRISISSGGVANSTTVRSGGSAVVWNSGMVNDLYTSGVVFINNGGSANRVMVYSGCSLTIYECGEVNGMILSGGNVYVSGNNVSYGVLNNAVLNHAAIFVFSGGIASNTTCSAGSFLISGGTAKDVIATSLGKIHVTNGGKITGRMTFASGALISAWQGTTIDFDLTQTEAGAEALVNDLSIIQGAPLYTLTVDGTQADGIYSLADGAASFSSTISVVNTEGDELGTLTVGETVTIGDADYTLNLNDTATGSTLTVTVAGSEPVPPTPSWKFYTGDFNGDGADMLAVETPEEPGVLPGSVKIYMNGVPWGLGLTLDYGWEVVGVGDFDGNGLDDFLRVNGEGYVVGEMSNGNGTFSPQVLNLKSAGWEILGVGDFNGNGTDDVLIANPTGASETVGLLGYWESGVTWTLINGYSPEWECVSTGDFNGDGKCDMLWRNSFEGEGGLTYNAYCTWITDDPVDWRMVSVANPDEWDFLCSGDFDGNGSHDIAMINGDGIVGIWGVNDGYLNSWSILSAVNPAEWQFSGVADFNGDGTDDIAWCNTETGLAGYWQINDKELTAWSNIATIS